MSSEPTGGRRGLTALAALRRFARPRPLPERCELCSLALPAEHEHLVELASRRLVCACNACAILFSGHVAGKHRRVPRRVDFLHDFRLPDVAWEELQLPINLAFFLHSSPAQRVVAFYPSPAGATEAPVPAEAWKPLAEENPILHQFEPDVEALLVNRVGDVREYYRVGVDACYKLVGILRMHWRGFSGGQGAWDEIGKFFTELKERSGYQRGGAHA